MKFLIFISFDLMISNVVTRLLNKHEMYKHHYTNSLFVLHGGYVVGGISWKNKYTIN